MFLWWKEIIYNNLNYLLKFPNPNDKKNIEVSHAFNVFSEYIGCKIFKSVGIEVQDVLLSLYEEISDGILKKEHLVEFLFL